MGAVMVMVQCPRCGKTRAMPNTDAKRETRRPNFRGYCRPCGIAALRAGEHRWHNSIEVKSPNRNGYRVISPASVPDELLPWFRQMQPVSRGEVLEHRWVMAVYLGRPLERNELVDHKNGIKTDNRPENLRLYIRGKNQAGSTNGHGTYYHEWQMAERQIKLLRAELAKLKQFALPI